MAPKGCVQLTFHVTGPTGPAFDEDEKKTAIVNFGRADIQGIIGQSAGQHKTLGIAGKPSPCMEVIEQIAKEI